jgi:hypothetical protein
MSSSHFQLFWQRARGLVFFVGIASAVFVGGEVVMLLRAGDVEARATTAAEPSVAVADLSSRRGSEATNDRAVASSVASHGSSAAVRAAGEPVAGGCPRSQKGQ